MVRGFSHLIPVTKKLDKTFLMSHIHNRGMQSKMITTVNKFAEYGGSFYPVVKFIEMTLPYTLQSPSSHQPLTGYHLINTRNPNAI